MDWFSKLILILAGLYLFGGIHNILYEIPSYIERFVIAIEKIANKEEGNQNGEN